MDAADQSSSLPDTIEALRSQGHTEEYILGQLRAMEERDFYEETAKMREAGVPEDVIESFWASLASTRIIMDEEDDDGTDWSEIDWAAVTALQDRYTEVLQIIDPQERIDAAKALAAEMGGE